MQERSGVFWTDCLDFGGAWKLLRCLRPLWFRLVAPIQGLALGGPWEALGGLGGWEGLAGLVWEAQAPFRIHPGKTNLPHLVLRGCYSTPGCGKAGERPGSTCAINVKGHKRRPPSKVGGICNELRV